MVCKHASAIFWDSVIGFIASSVPSSWSWTVQHFLRAGTLSGIVYRSATVSVIWSSILKYCTSISLCATVNFQWYSHSYRNLWGINTVLMQCLCDVINCDRHWILALIILHWYVRWCTVVVLYIPHYCSTVYWILSLWFLSLSLSIRCATLQSNRPTN